MYFSINTDVYIPSDWTKSNEKDLVSHPCSQGHWQADTGHRSPVRGPLCPLCSCSCVSPKAAEDVQIENAHR